jgi:FkbM family methyltransferase
MLPGSLRHTVTDEYGFRLNLDLSQLLDFEYALGAFDGPENEFLAAAWEEGSHFVDVGANEGFYSLFFAKRHPGAPILAFEPDPYNLDKLRDNVSANAFSNITVCPYALADTDDARPILLDSGRNRGANSLILELSPRRAQGRIVEVPCRTLLRALRDNGVTRVSALKIDIEGYEYPVLRKFFAEAPRTLFPKAVVVEAFPESIPFVGGSPLQLLVQNGYELVDHRGLNFCFRLGAAAPG